LHEWTDDTSGQFIYYPENSPEPKRLTAEPNSGIVTDGTKTIHAAGVYKPDI
jgi:hypothetical protein